MTRKILALTMVFVLSLGMAAFGSISGSWENELTLVPQTNPISGLTSELTVEYSTGGLNYESISTFDLSGYSDQTFGVSGTMGLLDLSSELNFDPSAVSMDYWKSTATLTLGGISVTDVFLLQNVKDHHLNNIPVIIVNGGDGETQPENDAQFNGYGQYPYPSLSGYGAGMELAVSGETPGGVTVDVANYFGMEPLDDGDKGLITGYDYSDKIPSESGYALMVQHDPLPANLVNLFPAFGLQEGDHRFPSLDYPPSSLQYVATQINLSGLALGCCEFDSETLFSEPNGFEYTQFEFTIASNSMPLELAADLKFTEQTKSIELTPSLDLAWACFDVYTDLSGTLANNGKVGDEIEGLEIEGFSLIGVEIGHITFSSYTALGGNTVYDLNESFLQGYDEVFRIEKSDALDLTVDVYFNMTQSDSLFDLAYIDTQADFALSNQFTLGAGVEIDTSPEADEGLNNITLSLDYFF